MEEIFKSYDIRGIYDKELTDKDAYFIGYYFAKLNNIKEILISHDGRISSKILSKYLLEGLNDAGVKIYFAGLNSTVSFYYGIHKLINTGIQITASHNPKEYNGFKLILNGDSYDVFSGLLDLKKEVKKDKDNKSALFNSINLDLKEITLNEFIIKREIEKVTITKNYVDFLYDFIIKNFTKEQIKRLRQYDFAIDFGNSVSVIAIKELFTKLQINVKYYNDKVDGTFPAHKPNPVEMEAYFKNKHLNAKHDFIVGFDGDGDRIGFLNEKKEMILNDYITALLLENFIKQKNKGFIFDLRISKIVQDLCIKNKLSFILSKVGRSYYIREMKKLGLYFGAETSGHFFYKEFYYFDNPDITLIYFLKILSETEEKILISDLIHKYQKYVKLKEHNFHVNNKDKVLENIKNEYKDYLVLTTDGYSFDIKNVWFNVRKSNTENVIRLNIEGTNMKIVQKYMNELEQIIK